MRNGLLYWEFLQIVVVHEQGCNEWVIDGVRKVLGKRDVVVEK